MSRFRRYLVLLAAWSFAIVAPLAPLSHAQSTTVSACQASPQNPGAAALPATDPSKGDYKANPLPTDAYVAAFDKSVWCSFSPAVQVLQTMAMGSSDRVALFNQLLASGVLRVNDPQILAYGSGPYFQIRMRQLYRDTYGVIFPAAWLTSTDLKDYPAYTPPAVAVSASFLCAYQGKLPPQPGKDPLDAYSACPGDQWPEYQPRPFDGHTYMVLDFGSPSMIGGQTPKLYFRLN